MPSERLPEEEQQAAGEHADNLFAIGRNAVKGGEFEKAYEAYVAAEDAAKGISGRASWRLMVRKHQGFMLIELDRWLAALALFDELVVFVEKLKAADHDEYVRGVLPDTFAEIYSGRLACLDHLRRFDEAREALAATLEEVGTPSTEVQRVLLTGAYLEEAKLAGNDHDYDRAFAAIDRLLKFCSQYDEESWVKSTRQEAAEMRRSLQVHARTAWPNARAQTGKPRSFLRALTKRRSE
jgi:tetratricopeptide (TPR) repeat protein